MRSDDAEALHALVEAIEGFDQLPRRTALTEMRHWLSVPWIDFAADSLVGEDRSGVPRAFGVVEIRPGDQTCVRAFLFGGVHPEWRGAGLGRAVLTWMEGRARQMLAATGRSGPARLAAYLDDSARERRQMYAAAGFSPIRWYTDMRRNLADALPDAQVPEGVRLVPWRADLDDAIRGAHNTAFGDHWGSQPHTVESWRSWRDNPHAAPEWSVVALDDHERVVGHLLAERHGLDVQEWTSGYIAVLGVVPQWRRRGLATALLVRAMATFAEAGVAYATLEVDTENPNGAHGFYTRLGFEPTHTTVLYSVEI